MRTDTDDTLTLEMERVLGIAIRDNGYVAAGVGAHAGHVERVAASTVRALIRRGYLEHCYSTEGGLAGRLTHKGFCFIPRRED